MEIVFRMFFLLFSNSDCELNTNKLTWGLYTIAETLTILKKVNLINQDELALMHPSWTLFLAPLQQEKLYQKSLENIQSIPAFFLPDLTIELLDNTGRNGHAIELVKSKQSLNRRIYSLSPIEFEILTTFNETYRKPRFVQSFKSSI